MTKPENHIAEVGIAKNWQISGNFRKLEARFLCTSDCMAEGAVASEPVSRPKKRRISLRMPHGSTPDLRENVPHSIKGYRGHVLLIDFWEFTCINCIRDFSVLKRWYAKYHSFGFDIVSVH